MARKFTASKTQLRPDPRFGSKLAGKFINCVMHNGKKSVAQQRLLRRHGAGPEAAAQREARSTSSPAPSRTSSR